MDIYWSNGFFGHTEINVCKKGFRRETHVEGARGLFTIFWQRSRPQDSEMFYFLMIYFGIFSMSKGLFHKGPVAKVISYQRSQNEGDSNLRIKGLLGY